MSQPSPSKFQAPPRSPKGAREKRILKHQAQLTQELLSAQDSAPSSPARRLSFGRRTRDASLASSQGRMQSDADLPPSDSISSAGHQGPTTDWSEPVTVASQPTRPPPRSVGGKKRKRHSSRLFGKSSANGPLLTQSPGDEDAAAAAAAVSAGLGDNDGAAARPSGAQKSSAGAPGPAGAVSGPTEMSSDENLQLNRNLATDFDHQSRPFATPVGAQEETVLDLPFSIELGFAVVVWPGDTEASMFPLDEPCSYEASVTFYSPSGTPLKSSQTLFRTVFRTGVLVRPPGPQAPLCALRQLSPEGRLPVASSATGSTVGLRHSALYYSPDGSPVEQPAGARPDRVSRAPTPDTGPLVAAADDEAFWFQFFRRELGPKSRISMYDVTAAELCMTEAEKRAAQKLAGDAGGGGPGGPVARQKFSRRNFFVRVRHSFDPANDDGLWVVKMNPDLRNSQVEFKINYVLRDKRVHSAFHTAKYAWTSQQSAVDPRKFHFVAVKFLDHAVPANRFIQWALSAARSGRQARSQRADAPLEANPSDSIDTTPLFGPWTTAMFRDDQTVDHALMDGIEQVLEAFSCVDPHAVLTGDRVCLWHRDLKPDAILVQPVPDNEQFESAVAKLGASPAATTGKRTRGRRRVAPGEPSRFLWKVLDFGLSELHHINGEGFYEKICHSVGASTPTGLWREEVWALLDRFCEPVRNVALRRQIHQSLIQLRSGKKTSDQVLLEIRSLREQ